MTSTYPQRLGAHHFAHLRAVAEGLSIQDAAQRYLGVEHGNAAMAAHRAVVDQLRASARRRGDSRWRLIGLFIHSPSEDKGRPTLEDWSAEQGLEDWGQAELVTFYEEAFPPDRHASRNRRLRRRQLDLLRELEGIAAEAARPHDPIDSWFEPASAERLRRAGLQSLEDLQRLIQRGGRWWRSIPGVGPTKAARMDSLLHRLLPAAPAMLGAPKWPALQEMAAASVQADTETIEAWIAARAGSAATARAYRREATRLRLWACIERRRPLSALVEEDCLAYQAFLERVPAAWISRRRASPLQAGWAPFAGQLSVASQRQAVVILGAFFAWLVETGHVSRNPWMPVNRRLFGDAKPSHQLDRRAFESEVWRRLLDWIERQALSTSRARALFVLRFTEATGLRAAELVAAQLGDLRPVDGQWAIQVHGKGARQRLAAVPSQAVRALEDYLLIRGLPPLERAPHELPLLTRIADSTRPIGYKALYQTMRSWLSRALAAASLTQVQRQTAARASLHWLRNTCGVRALERGAPLEAVQHQLGHADPRTTLRHARPSLGRLIDSMEQAFGDATPPSSA